MNDLNVRIPIHDGTTLDASLHTPRLPRGATILATCGGDGVFPVRDRRLAAVLEHIDMTTMVVDLLCGAPVHGTPGLLAERLARASEWMQRHHPGLPVSYVGIGTAATAALVAAAQHPASAVAVVAWSPRPEQAGFWLDTLAVPVLLLAAEEDGEIVEQCRDALKRLPGYCAVDALDGASRDFQAPDVAQRAADRTATWLMTYAVPPVRR